MNRLYKLGVTGKLVGMLLAFAILPVAIISFMVFSSFEDIKKESASRFENVAVTIADKIDRSLFERYGDVQAFGLNRVIWERSSWYKTGKDNQIADAMNQYVTTYGIYSLTILVDLEGKVIAVNSRDASGETINSSSLYSKNYANSAWFKALKNNVYTTRMPHTAPGNDISTGTFIEDLHIDEDVKMVYPGDEGMSLGFSAPVYKNGKIIAYWSNRTYFSLVEEFYLQAYQALKKSGYASAELTLLDSTGKIIVDYDPKVKGSEVITHDFGKVIMKLNLAEKGVKTAQAAVAGETGNMYSFHARKEILQAAGYTHLKGALGFPGMNWSVLVRVPESEAAPWLAAIERNLMIIVLVCVVICAVIGLWIGRRVVAVVLNIVSVTQQAAEGDLNSRIEVKSSDEIGQLGHAFNSMMERVSSVIIDIRSGSDSIKSASMEIASGNMDLSHRTEEQASSLEETASSMEEMTSTVKQNADNAMQANQLATSARDIANEGGKIVSDAVSAMLEINASSNKIADIISVVEEIAFQTNLLALNAAVEAARAGEQGRGFAVVATEVRSLAGRSADASKEIKSLIEESLDKVKVGSDLVDKSGNTLDEIVLSVKKVSDIVSEISASSREQATGVEEVNKAVMQMDEMTQQNAALVEEAASASKSMESQANDMSRVLEYFTVDSSSLKSIRPSIVRDSSSTHAAVDRERRKSNRPFKNETTKISNDKPVVDAPPLSKTGTGDDWAEF